MFDNYRVKLASDKKLKYEYCFILCLSVYIIYSICDLVFCGISALQWRVLNNGGDFIADFTNVIGYSAERDPYNHTIVYGLHEKAYPPLQYVFSYLISNTISDKQHYYDIANFTSMFNESKITMLYIVFTCITMICIFECIRSYKNGTNCIKTLTALCITLSFPFIFIIERGNSLLAVFLFIMFYFRFYNDKNKLLRELSFISLALAAAIKLTPAILGVLLLMERRWKEAIRTIIYGVILFFVPFSFFDGGFGNIPLFIRNLGLQLDKYKYEAGCTLKGYLLHYYPYFSAENFNTLSAVCSVITIIVCVLMLFAAIFTHRKCDRLLYLCLIMIILPSHSGAYCIVYIVPAIIAFLNEDKEKKLILDKYIILGGCFCFCEIGGYLGHSILNYHNGLLILVVCSVVKSVEVVSALIKRKKNIKEISLKF